MLKKIIFSIFLLLTIFSLSSCNDDNIEDFNVTFNGWNGIKFDYDPHLNEARIIGTLDTFNKSDLVIPTTFRDMPITIIDARAFELSGLVNVDFSRAIYLERIGSHAFSNNSISSLYLTNLSSLRYVEMSAFERNNINSLTLNNLPSLEVIGFRAFLVNNIYHLYLTNLPLLRYIGGISFSSNRITSLFLKNLPSLVDIGSNAFATNRISTIHILNTPLIGDDPLSINIIFDRNTKFTVYTSLEPKPSWWPFRYTIFDYPTTFTNIGTS